MGAIRRFGIVPAIVLVAVLVVWTLGAWLTIFVFAGAHPCTLLQTVGDAVGASPVPTLRPLTEAEYAAAMDRCNRPDVGAIAVSTIGYIVIATMAIRRYGERPS